MHKAILQYIAVGSWVEAVGNIYDIKRLCATPEAAVEAYRTFIGNFNIRSRVWLVINGQAVWPLRSLGDD